MFHRAHSFGMSGASTVRVDCHGVLVVLWIRQIPCEHLVRRPLWTEHLFDRRDSEGTLQPGQGGRRHLSMDLVKRTCGSWGSDSRGVSTRISVPRAQLRYHGGRGALPSKPAGQRVVAVPCGVLRNGRVRHRRGVDARWTALIFPRCDWSGWKFNAGDSLTMSLIRLPLSNQWECRGRQYVPVHGTKIHRGDIVTLNPLDNVSEMIADLVSRRVRRHLNGRCLWCVSLRPNRRANIDADVGSSSGGFESPALSVQLGFLPPDLRSGLVLATNTQVPSKVPSIACPHPMR